MNMQEELTKAILSAIYSTKNKEIALGFSGGLDSSLIAFLLSKENKVQLYTCGLKNSYDIITAEETAKILSLPLKKILLSEKEIKEETENLSEIINCKEILILSFELPLYFVAKECNEKIIATGQGADEMFGGYVRYLSMQNLEKELNKDIENLLNVGVEREKKIAEHFGKELSLPFLNKEIVKIAKKVPIEFKVKNGKRKIILREVAKTLGLKNEIAEREKKAVQYGSGIFKIIKKIKKEKLFK